MVSRRASSLVGKRPLKNRSSKGKGIHNSDQLSSLFFELLILTIIIIESGVTEDFYDYIMSI